MEKFAMKDFSWNVSYVYAVDNESGWGGRYFFTYFSQLDERPFAETCVEILVYSIIFFCALVANVSIIVCVARYQDMKTVTNCFVFNLAAADIIFAGTIPIVAYTRISVSWTFGDITCKIVPYVQFVSGVVLLWTLALISIDRYRCIVVPPYRSKMTPCQASLASLIIWFFASFIFSPLTFWFRQIKTESGTSICTLIFPKSSAVHYSVCFVLPTLLFACILPMIMLVFYYQRIFRKILSTKNAWASSCVMISAVDTRNSGSRAQTRRQSELSLSDIFVPWPRKFSAQFSSPNPANARHGSLSHHEEIRLHKHIKVVRLLFLNVIVVLLMWLPITIIMILIFIDGRRENEDKNYFLKSYHFLIALSIAYANTVVNPLLYGLLSDNFRACLVKMWCKQEKCLKDLTTPSSGRQNTNNGICRTKKASLAGSLSEKSEKNADRTNDF